MATAPLPKQTPANDALIKSLPFDQLTARQVAYADKYGLTLQSANAIQPQLAPYYAPGTPIAGGGVVAPSTATPAGPTTSGGVDPNQALIDSNNALLAYQQQTDADTKAAAAEIKAQGQRDALALIKGTLAQYDLPDTLGDWAWQEIVGGKSSAEVMLDLQQRPEFKQTFPEIEARQKAGLAPLAPSDIINYRQQARQMMQAAGLPAGFYDSPQDFSKFLINDTSLSELSSRITDAAQAAYNAPPEYKQQWDQLGFGHGDLTAMMLNPDLAEPLLHKQWTAAQLAGTGVRTGYGQLNAGQALGLTELGVTVPQAEQGFGNLAHQQELFNPLNGGETAINQNDQLAAQFGGNAAAQQRIQDRARARVSTFSGGGGFAGTTAGYSGVGNSGQ